jgi:hypothetical protein
MRIPVRGRCLRTLSEQLADALAAEIAAGRLAPGQRLIPQREFARERRIASPRRRGTQIALGVSICPPKRPHAKGKAVALPIPRELPVTNYDLTFKPEVNCHPYQSYFLTPTSSFARASRGAFGDSTWPSMDRKRRRLLNGSSRAPYG